VAQEALTIVAAARPHPHETISGDAWGAVWSAPHSCRIAVIDGLGHGPEAAKAAQTALALLATHPDLAADAAMRACHRALVGTRGAAVSIVDLDLQLGTLICAGVGNVDARLWQPGREQRLMIQRGIVGANIPTIRPTDLSLGDKWCLLLHTDGVSDRFDLASFPGFQADESQALVDAILDRHGRTTDDATVVLARPRLA
jgi:hypothetical protein